MRCALHPEENLELIQWSTGTSGGERGYTETRHGLFCILFT